MLWYKFSINPNDKGGSNGLFTPPQTQVTRKEVFMKKKILHIAKKVLPFLVVGLYIACCVDAFIHIQPHESSPVSFLSLIFSVLFFVSCILLLWVFRESSGVLWFSLILSALSAISILCNWLPTSYAMGMIIFALLVYAPFYGLSFFPFTHQDAGFPWFFIGILALLFIYKLVLLILLKIDFYNKRRRQTNETT